MSDEISADPPADESPVEDVIEGEDRDEAAAEPSDRRLVRALSGLLVLVLGACAVVWWLQREDDPSRAVMSSARTAVTTFFTLDHATIEKDLDAMAALSTGEFATNYEEQRTELAAQVTQKKLVISAQLRDSGTGIEYLTEDDAQVLVAVDATTTPTEGTGETSHYRIRVVLSHEDDRWLVADLEQVG